MSSILLIGTRLNKLTYLTLLLEKSGYTTYRCHDWLTMDQLVAEKRPDLIVADDGNSQEHVTALMQHLQANPNYMDLPVILLAKTAVVTLSIKKVLIKPILPHILVITIGKILQVKEKNAQQQWDPIP